MPGQGDGEMIGIARIPYYEKGLKLWDTDAGSAICYASREVNLRVNRRDVVVFHMPERLSRDAHQRTHQTLKRLFGSKQKILLLEPGVTMRVIHR